MSDMKKTPAFQGAFLGLTAAFLFGCSMPLAKVLLGAVQPFLLAGLFYLGSGLGLTLWLGFKKTQGAAASQQAPLRKADLPWLAAAIFFGGISAELLLMFGLQKTSASAASLLLNLEGAFSAMIAWIVFKEHANVHVVCGMLAITSGAMLLGVEPNWHLSFSWASLCVVAACLGWGIDNNLTRKVSHLDPVQISAIKGIVAGVVNISIGLAAGGTVPAPAILLASMVLGLLSYGVSLVLFIFGMRHIGAARTSAYFSAAPFVGAAGSILFLHDPVNVMFIAAAALMAVGLWLHLTEDHEHEHTHVEATHEHRHSHDAHHQHEHAPGDPPGETHTHVHVHDELTHSHEHFPDIHHRHIH